MQAFNHIKTVGDAQTITASKAGKAQRNYDHGGAVFAITTGTPTGTSPTLTVKVQGSVDGGVTYYDIPGAATAAISTATTTVLTLARGATAAANSVVAQPLPRDWRLYYTLGGTDTPTVPITAVNVCYVR